MNKDDLEALMSGEAAPLLYRLALVIAAHPLRWVVGAVAFGAGLGWVV